VAPRTAFAPEALIAALSWRQEDPIGLHPDHLPGGRAYRAGDAIVYRY
jgi:hypothetical protein